MTRQIRNILFVMFDQLRWDYLSCTGHPTLKTPHIDAVAAKGVRFTRTYVQSPICGSSRMSFYTGRYVHSHGAHRNNFPLKVGEMTLGDHLRANGMDAFLVGKTHMEADAKGLERLGIAPDSVIGARLSECGFDVVIRDDGLWPEGPDGFYDERRSPYNEYLKEKGYPAANPWSENANAGITEDGEIASAWFMKNANMPANIREEDSETPWLTTEAIRFVDEREGARPWLCHLSYIKPHWPYIVPAPYNELYGPDDLIPIMRSEIERENPHPVYAAYMDTRVAQSISRDEVRDKVLPAYMALIKQCDDQIGRLMAHLEATGRMEDTMIVLTSDHGDYMGDHWLGEKNFFHEAAVKIPMIIYDPRPEADATRGTTCDALVESIDLAATFVEATGAKVPDHVIEGRALTGWLHGKPPQDWRDYVICEFDYSTTPLRKKLGLKPRDARAFMIFDGRWKMIHFEGGFRPMLFDHETDPDEFHDLGELTEHEAEIDRLYTHLGAWARRMSQRTALSDEEVEAMGPHSARRGVTLGLYDGSEVEPEMTETLRGKAKGDFREKPE
ncbi:sulfatase-like hydrolase/transferase [Paracoccus albus]|uniref:sulfatase-like hydrolase/transferase n=1 Tax=Paracoccus albus TaxID=3017784 RepID=UPI0022F03F1B|nr:sulfatase-like hydrolase/transferase [Paracoccus albus]WBU59266.1 sulfatase-like hydrolase/transferase [Paracoccus albus]